MKITQAPADFRPIVITLETREEAIFLKHAIADFHYCIGYDKTAFGSIQDIADYLTNEAKL